MPSLPAPPPPAASAQAARRAWLRQAGAAVSGLGLAAAWPLAHGQLPVQEDPDTNRIWLAVRSSVLGGRPVLKATPEQLQLDAPTRAVDAAVVPIAIRCRIAPTAQRQVSRLMLVIDHNPSPVGLTVQLTPESGRADIETRVRVDAYSHVRALAELSDGTLLMSTRYVKASGGCSAPAAGDAAVALARLGQIRLQPEAWPPGNEPLAVQLQVNHPNHSGLAMDQSTRQYTPAHFVRQVEISLAGRPVLSADMDFTLSENPYLRFYLLPGSGGELRARVVDSQDRHFSASRVLVRPVV